VVSLDDTVEELMEYVKARLVTGDHAQALDHFVASIIHAYFDAPCKVDTKHCLSGTQPGIQGRVVLQSVGQRAVVPS